MSDIEDPKTTVEKPSKLIGVRHFQYVLLFFCAVIGYGMRTNLSTGIVAMTAESNENNPDIPTYPEWKDYKNTMLSSFFWGYVCLQIGAGEIAKRFGAKRFLAGAMAICSIFTVLIPVLAASWGYQGVIFCRVIQGLGQGFMFPSFHHLLSVWTPIGDRSKIISFVYTGGPLGNVISLLVTGLISDSKAGWPVAFYLYGGIGFVWVLLYLIFGSNTPADNKFISDSEKKYIEAESPTENAHEIATPWKAIATSLPMSAILIAHCGQNWGFWTLLTEIPTYLKEVLGLDMKNNAMLSALPYFTLWVLSFIMSPLADYLITRNIWSIGKTRKIFNTVGLVIPAISLATLGLLENASKTTAIALLVIAVGINSASYVGFNGNHIDIAPNHAGTLMGITNSFSNIFSIVAPLAIDAIERTGNYEESDKELWTIVFCLAASIYTFVAIYFAIFASGDIQDWNDENYAKNTTTQTTETKKSKEVAY